MVFLDLANGSGQSGSGLTHADSGKMGSGQKTGRPKWVAQPMTLTLSFKGRVKTGLTRIFTHKQKHSQIKEYGKKNSRCHRLYQIINLLRCTFFFFC
jgi:hypothetical protein